MVRTAFAIASMMWLGHTMAAEPDSDTFGQRLAAFQAEVDAQQSVQPVSFQCDHCGDSSCDGGGECQSYSGCDSCGVVCGCGQPTFYGGIDLMIVRPYANSEGNGPWSVKRQLGTRLTLGGENSNGLGSRFRWFTYDHASIVGGTPIGVDVDVIDIDFYQRLGIGRSSLAVGGGFKYGRLGFDDDNFEGVGVNFLVEGLLPVCDRGCGTRFDLIANSRWAYLGGDWHGPQNFVNHTDDDTLSIWEVQLGAQYTKQMGSGRLVTRCVYEYQNWSSDHLGDDINGIESSMSFVSPNIYAGFEW